MPDDAESMRIDTSYNLFGKGWEVPQRSGPGRALPRVWSAKIDAPTYPFVVELRISLADGRPTVDAVSLVRRETDPPIVARSLRDVPLGRFVDAACAAAELRIEETAPGEYKIAPLSDADYEEREAKAEARLAARRARTDPSNDVERAAALYDEALGDDEWRRKPTLYVAKQLHVSRSTASRLLARAREGT